MKADLHQSGTEAYIWYGQQIGEALQQRNMAKLAELIEAGASFQSAPSKNDHLRRWWQYAKAVYIKNIDGDHAGAIALLEQLRAEEDTLPLDLRGRVLIGVGMVYAQHERWDRATHAYLEASLFYESEGDTLGRAKVLQHLAELHYKAQDYTQASDYAQQSINLLVAEADRSANLAVLSGALNELGMAQTKLGQILDAKASLFESLAIDTELEDRMGQAISFNNLAHIHRQLGQLDEAIGLYEGAYEIAKQDGLTFQMAEAAYGKALLTLTQLGQGTVASTVVEQRFDEALRLADSSNYHEILTDIRLGQAEMYEQTGDLKKALAVNRDVVEIAESLRANILIPEDRVRMQGSRIDAYEQLVRRLHQTKNIADAFYYAEMAKSRAFIEMLSDRPVRPPRNVPKAWLTEEQELREQLRQCYQAGQADEANIATLEAKLDQVRQRIRVKDAEFESFQTVKPLSLNEVQARLPQDAVLLEYFTIGDEIYAFVIGANEQALRRLPIRLSQLSRVFVQRPDGTRGQIRHLTKDAQHRLHAPWTLKKLAQSLLEPLGEAIWSAHTLCIVPHGLLHYVPFHALYQDTDNGPLYLLGSSDNPRQIIYAPSATTLLDYCQQKRESTQTGCLAVGYNDPVLNLSQAEAEANHIAERTNGLSFVGQAATRENLYQQSQAYRYLHFSCHGWFNATWPMASSLSLADGTLDAADILHHLQLNAELVSLSACETGRSHLLRGDELVGLIRAFLYAGTPSVLVSHWVVDELVTRLLMERFYECLIDQADTGSNASKAKALGEAQSYIRTLTLSALRQRLEADQSSSATITDQLTYLKIVAGYDPQESLPDTTLLLAHPYYWAGFF
ncbi:MAG: CHAT domain-containing tetratricopeptide repeat protein, partial [Chloroflexota bacterium]